MGREEVLAFLGSCFNGEPASCSYACPYRPDLRAFLKKAAKGRWDAAYRELSAVIPFPAITAALCPRPCERSCQCAAVLGGDAVDIRAVEEACLTCLKSAKPTVYAIPMHTEKIAVVGAGPVGLSCALTLARKKYPVTVFEMTDTWGGHLKNHPDFSRFDAEFSLQFSADKPEFRFETELCALEDLNGFDAVFLACGKTDFGLRSGWNDELFSTERPGVFLALPPEAELQEAMAAAVRCVRSIEAYLQTGSCAGAAEAWNRENACRYAPHGGCDPTRRVAAESGGTYSDAEARAEAARCLQCDCSECMNACELMVKYNKKPPRIASDVIQDAQTRNSVSSASITRETWSCNLCGRCASICPEGTDIGGMLQDSRKSRVNAKLYPPALHDYRLREMQRASDEAALVIPPKGKRVFFPGCRLGAGNPDNVLLTYSLLRKEEDAGLVLNCCGAPAYWAGEETLFQNHLDTLRKIWQSLGQPEFLCACSSCERMLNRFLPEIPTVSVYAALPAPERLAFDGKRFSVFDPCAAQTLPATRQAVRSLAAQCGASLTDFDSSGKCCGFGGHMQLANPALYDEITKARAAADDAPYLVYCTNCRDVFEAEGKECTHILDLYFGTKTGWTTLEEKRRNALSLKRQLSDLYKIPTDPAREAEIPDIVLEADDVLLRKLDRILVSTEDVKSVLSEAETNGTGFVNADGVLLASGERGAITVWAEAQRLPDRDGKARYRLLNAYCHRMHLGRED